MRSNGAHWEGLLMNLSGILQLMSQDDLQTLELLIDIIAGPIPADLDERLGLVGTGANLANTTDPNVLCIVPRRVEDCTVIDSD